MSYLTPRCHHWSAAYLSQKGRSTYRSFTQDSQLALTWTLIAVVAVCIAPIVSVGWGSERVSSTTDAISYDRETQKEKDDAVRDGVLTLEHDFGVVRDPGKQLLHRFKIHNDTASLWTFRQILSNCACTVAAMTAPVIPPGKTECVEITYRSPGLNSDGRQAVLVRFREIDAPTVALVVKARVRSPLTLSPERLTFSQAYRHGSCDSHFEVQNFSDHRWEAISVHPSECWLKTDTTLLDTDPQAGSPHQTWRVDVHVEASELPAGSHQAAVEVSESGGNTSNGTVPVTLTIAPPLKVIPPTMFFGRVLSGVSARQSIVVRFAPGFVVPRPSDITLSDDLGGALSLRWTETRGSEWLMEGSLIPRELHGLVKGHVTLKPSRKDLPLTEVPVCAFVESEQ